MQAVTFERKNLLEMASPKERGRGKNKRIWTEEEDDAFIEVLKDLVNGGTTFRADNGFKPGFLNTVEEALNAKLPGSNFKAIPHIHSRLRRFKKVFTTIHDMVVGSCTSGFGWDPEKKVVVAEKEVWKAYVKNHPAANDWKGKPCPYYEDLCIIFGKDRAAGQDAQGPIDIEKEVNDEDVNEELATEDVLESSATQEPSERAETSSGKSGNTGKRARVSENLVKGLAEVATILGREIRSVSSDISRAVGFDVELSEKRSKLNEELSKLGLTTMERHRAARKIASEPETIDLFFSIPDSEKKEWVLALLRGDI